MTFQIMPTEHGFEPADHGMLSVDVEHIACDYPLGVLLWQRRIIEGITCLRGKFTDNESEKKKLRGNIAKPWIVARKFFISAGLIQNGEFLFPYTWNILWDCT